MSFWDFLKPKKKPVKPFHMTFTVPAHKIHVVDDPGRYQHFRPRAKKAKGYFVRAHNGNPAEVWILGKKRKDGKVVPKQGYRILGHEYWHFLDWLDRKEVITNPDEVLVKEEYD